MNENEIGTFLYAPGPSQDILANDGASFSAPYFAQVQSALQLVRSLPYGQGATLYPNNYQEDLVQADRRNNFRLSDWFIAAITLDQNGYLLNALLIEKNHHQEGGVYSFASQSLVLGFYRGFLIQESPESPVLNGDDFLASLGFNETPSEEKEETALYYSGQEDGNAAEEPEGEILVARPVFEANGKRKIVNLGGAEIEEPAADNNADSDDEALDIHVQRPAFEAGGKNKIRNLGNSQSAEDEEDEDEGPKSISVERPTFVAGGHGKPVNLNATPDRPKRKPAISQPENSDEETEIAPQINPPRPAFEAVSTKKVPNLDVPAAKPQAKKPSESSSETPKPVVPETPVPTPVVKPAFEASSKKDIRNFDSVVKEEKRNWTSIDVYKLRPDVYHRERSIIADPSDPNALAFCKKIYDTLKTYSTLGVSSDLLFVPQVLNENDPHLKAVYHFDASAFDLLALTVNGNDEPYLVLLSSKAEPDFCLVVSLKHQPVLECLSLKGASLDDRALPYLVYPALRAIVFPH